MEIGRYNKLCVTRIVDFGAYLSTAGQADGEVLLPARYITEPLHPGDELEVFVYKDSEDRPVAVTDRPLATVGEFAFLRVAAVNKVGAFLDWGLPKDLLVPYSEQNARMKVGGVYPVYVYLDHETGRVAASARLNKYLDNLPPRYHTGSRVEALVLRHADRGWVCVVDNLFSGMIYDNELFCSLQPGQKVKASVHRVRPDGKIDLTVGGTARDRSHAVADAIEERLRVDGRLGVNERSDAGEIAAAFGCSKKDFKKAVGHLLKARKCSINDCGDIVFTQK